MTRSGGWGVAIVAALFMHSTALLSLAVLGSRTIAAPRTHDPGSSVTVDLVPSARATEPKSFTELPEDRAGPEPDSPDFLSNVASRAQDRVPGGEDGSLPRMDGRAESPQVAMTASPPESPAAGGPGDAGEPRPGSPEPTESAREDDERGSARSGGVAAPPSPAGLPGKGIEGSTGGGDAPSRPRGDFASILQEAMANSLGNAPGLGDISLSTTAWEYAPWVIAFRRAVLERWTVPTAYSLGMLQGWALIEVEIGRDGRLLRLDVVEDDVTHWSLTDAAANALRRAAPYGRLPGSFPDETLVLRLRFVYPRWRR